jgi:very-short-patch-repair endonuclease/predicted transcriptional regulator of viral defense system
MDALDGPPPWQAVAELAARQWGAVSLEQLRACGAGRGAVDKAVRAGRLHRLYRGVYAVGHAHLGREGRRLAAVLASGEGAVLSHRTAAAHWGLLETNQARVDVTARRGRREVAGIRLHWSRSLTARDTAIHDGIPITSIARTLLDLAGTARADRLERALAQAERAQLYDHAAIEDVLSRANGHGGKQALTRATAQEPKLTRSELEARFLGLVRQAGLPEPETNLTLTALDHLRLDPDFYWPTYRLVVETDGWETHRTRAAFRSDRRRDAALVASGYRVLRFTYDDVASDGATVTERLRAAAAQAA